MALPPALLRVAEFYSFVGPTCSQGEGVWTPVRLRSRQETGWPGSDISRCSVNLGRGGSRPRRWRKILGALRAFAL